MLIWVNQIRVFKDLKIMKDSNITVSSLFKKTNTNFIKQYYQKINTIG